MSTYRTLSAIEAGVIIRRHPKWGVTERKLILSSACDAGSRLK